VKQGRRQILKTGIIHTLLLLYAVTLHDQYPLPPVGSVHAPALSPDQLVWFEPHDHSSISGGGARQTGVTVTTVQIEVQQQVRRPLQVGTTVDLISPVCRPDHR